MATLAEALTESIELLAKLSIPLYRDVDQKPAIIGTGFFVSIGDSSLLVSAAHVLEEARNSPVYYYVAPRVRRAIAGKLVTNTHLGLREDDKVDLGAVVLEGSHQPPYPEVDKFPVPQRMLNHESIPAKDSRYGFIGFPASRGRVRKPLAQVKVEPYAYMASLATETEYRNSELSPSVHICLQFNRKKSFGLDGKGRSYPKPHGISGSPIFCLYDEEETRETDSFLLAGVITTWIPEKNLIYGAGIGALTELIAVATMHSIDR